MPAATYYPSTNEGRAEWWENILTAPAGSALTVVGFGDTKINAIEADAAWAVYVYRTIRNLYEEHYKAVVAYAQTAADGIGGTSGEPLPAPPIPPTWPTAPLPAITADFEKRREEWVQEAKNSSTYTNSIGETLRIIGSSSPFDPNTYTAILLNLGCHNPKTISGKFRKANGNIDGVIFRGRKQGTANWQQLGKFTANPFSALVPLAGLEPEQWEFQARAFKKDVEIGNWSAIHLVTITA